MEADDAYICVNICITLIMNYIKIMHIQYQFIADKATRLPA